MENIQHGMLKLIFALSSFRRLDFVLTRLVFKSPFDRTATCTTVRAHRGVLQRHFQNLVTYTITLHVNSSYLSAQHIYAKSRPDRCHKMRQSEELHNTVIFKNTVY